MLRTSRRNLAIFVLIFGICLTTFAVALNVGWILLSLEQIALLVLGIIFFALIITGLILNTIFLFREIRRNEQHDAFINSVTHELKTPIASLRLYLETLKTRETDEEQRQKFYDTMLADTERLNRMVEQVLFAGSTGDRRRRLHLSKIKLNKLLQDSTEVVRSRYGLGESAVHLETNGEVKVRGDAQELQIAFTNLLDNAVKYSKDEVNIDVKVESVNEKRVEIQITDSGIGISQNELKRVFRRFYRVPGRASQRVKGTGIGLSIVQAIIKKHGGKILAKSAGEGLGSTFVVRLPKA
ncbi:MAG: HAMP domain-containing sensor histidine kinase [Pyrinomonadaceae bacterium]